jgi:type VI secretion system secreted protein Hcp
MENSNIILKIGDLKGSCTLDGYKDLIECDSWSFSVAQPTSGSKSGSERTAANPIFSDISLTKEADISSTSLMRLCTLADEVAKAEITILRKADTDNKPLIVINLDKVIVSNYVIQSSGLSRPVETITLNFVIMKMTYHHQSNDGKVTGSADFGYDLSLNTKV